MDQKYNYESTTVKWSVLVLCISFALIYIVLYYVKWDLFKWNDLIISTSTWLNLSEITDNYSDYSMKNNSWSVDILAQSTWLFTDDMWSLDNNNVDDKAWDLVVSDLSNKNTAISDGFTEMIVLRWTRTYYWSLDFVDLLWISYKYALKDDKWIYYLNMDGYNYDFSDIARKLGWNLYIMNTESEILANKMFGNKVTYINIPEYANKKVLMLIDVNSQSRLIAVDYSVYHQSKSYLQSLFIY